MVCHWWKCTHIVGQENVGLTAAVSPADAEIHKRNLVSCSGTTKLIISNEDKEDIMKQLSLKDVNMLIKGITKTIQNETKE